MALKTVLVVEDHEDLRQMFSDVLNMAGFQVRQAADGMEALRSIDSAPPDLIVLDLGLPFVTGYDVLLELKDHAHTRAIPVLVVTGSDAPIEGVLPDCVLRKPVRPSELAWRVKDCLGEG